MKFLIPIVLLAIPGCTSFIEFNKPIEFPEPKPMLIEVRKLEGGDFNVLGIAEIVGSTCTIYIRRYPQCLLHEVRHCFEGNWHEGKKSDEDCY